MRMFVAGQWIESGRWLPVCNPYDGEEIDRVPAATVEQAGIAVEGAVQGARVMRALTAYDRGQILRRAADIMHARLSELGQLISREEGKTLAEGNFEAARATETMYLSAEESRRLRGEVLPLDAAPGGAGKLGLTMRVPCGVVVAITPFNFPLNLVCHKVGPALAAGNAVIVKPASDTPLSALELVRILLEAGLPPEAISCLTGAGRELGQALSSDARVRKISFTGSSDVGRAICQAAGLKRVTMELGSNSPLIVLPDADLERVATAIVATGYGNAGQTCISTQRVYVLREVYDELLQRLRPRVEAIRVGDPACAETRMGPMIRESDARRVEGWVREAVDQGARLICGGDRQGTRLTASLLADIRPSMRVSCEELFGPVVGVSAVSSVEESFALANDSHYGLSAGIFTQDIDRILAFVRQVDSGNLHINWGPGWRADLMPYGGLKESGMGREGPAYAIEEMTEWKTVVIHGGS